jgi:Zn-finger nucleic acid-binding protein
VSFELNVDRYSSSRAAISWRWSILAALFHKGAVPFVLHACRRRSQLMALHTLGGILGGKMAADASSLHCPNCGASADPDARRCPFCKARLATVSCPSCFALMFDGAKFCPTCGARRSRAAEEDANARCPGCKAQLQRLQLGATPLLECATCDGVWMDAAVFEQLCADKESQAAVLHKFRGAATPGAGRVKYRPCARCGKMMNRVNFGRMSGVVVDVCKGHGTYLDPGELHQIVTFIQAGGLERARARQLEDLREQERDLRDRAGRLARAHRRTDQHPGLELPSWTFMIGDD